MRISESKRSLLLAAAVTPLVIGLATNAALAQEASTATTDDSSDEIVVTGFRSSLASALNAKRTEAATVDVIKAEDIADFPDLNLAESLQRIPGVAISRIGGEGRQISVRGLGPEYTRVRINGMEALATSGAADAFGGANRGRGFDFNVFASELFNSLTVRKSASADVEEGSLGATVDLQTARPFDYREPTLAASAQIGYNDLSKKPAARFSLIGANTWLDGRLGALLSVAYDKRRILQEGASSTRWDTGGSNGGFNPASTLPGVTAERLRSTSAEDRIYHPRIPALNGYDQKEDRLGITGSIQFQPTDRTLLTFDALYSKLDGSREERVLQALSFSRSGSGKPQTIIRDGAVDANNNLIYGVFDNVDVRAHHRYDELTTEFQQYTGSFEHEFSDRFKIGGLAGWSKSMFTNPINTTITLDRINVQGFSYDYRENSRLPKLVLGFDPTDPASWQMVNGTSEVRIRPSSVENKFKQAKLFGEFEATDSIRLKAGIDYRQFDFASDEKRRILNETVVQTLTPAQVAEITELYSGFGRNLGAPDGNPTSWILADLDKFNQLYNIYSNSGLYELGGVENGSARGNIGTVREKDLGGFVQAAFETELGGLPLRGDIGVRFVETKQISTGYAAVGSNIELVTAERKYTNTLPSMNLVADVTDNFLIRFGAARTLARPSIGNLSPGGDVSVQGGNRNFSTGNPDLAPTKSDNLDLGFEWYPERGALLSLGLFYKDIGTFAQTLRTEAPYNTLGLPLELIAGLADPSEVFQVTRPVNTKGGKLKGFELNGQRSLGFIAQALENFGVLANYTYVDSKINYLTSSTPGAPTVNATLIGLSKHAANGTLYYEDERFGIRGSLAYRSGYLTTVPGRHGNDVEGTNSTLNLDMQASYTLNDHLRFTIEALNLTDEFNDQYIGPNRSVAYNHTGRQFYFGIRYTY